MAIVKKTGPTAKRFPFNVNYNPELRYNWETGRFENDAAAYDPAPGELKIDERQQGFIVDPNRTLEEVVAEYDARNAKRMSELEGGGLLTGRCLAEFARRHLPEDKQKTIEREGLTRKDAVRKVMEGK